VQLALHKATVKDRLAQVKTLLKQSPHFLFDDVHLSYYTNQWMHFERGQHVVVGVLTECSRFDIRVARRWRFIRLATATLLACPRLFHQFVQLLNCVDKLVVSIDSVQFAARAVKLKAFY